MITFYTNCQLHQWVCDPEVPRHSSNVDHTLTCGCLTLSFLGEVYISTFHTVFSMHAHLRHSWVNPVFTCHGLPLTSCEAQICTLKLQSHFSGQSANVLDFSDVTPNTKFILASFGVSHISFFKMLKMLEGSSSFAVISDFNLKGETSIIVNFMLSVQKREI